MQISRFPFTRGGGIPPNNRWKRDLINHWPLWFLAKFDFFAAIFVGGKFHATFEAPVYQGGPPNNRWERHLITYWPQWFLANLEYFASFLWL